MPSRNSESSDAPPSSHRSSLHRFSSIASFHVLNPFHRRRSNNATDSTAGSSTSTADSSVSLSSTIANAPQPLTASTSSSNFLRMDDERVIEKPISLPIPPIPEHLASRKSSYFCLPDDPIGGMPRSRTFSNLPLPSRARNLLPGERPMAPSKSHSRLPSAILPSTRLPSPAVSSRKHSISKLGISEQKTPLIRNRVKRSDTEPLLQYNPAQANNVGRSTAFKENISASPVKPLPHMDRFENKSFYGSSLPSRAYASRHGWVDPCEAREPLLREGQSCDSFTRVLDEANYAVEIASYDYRELKFASSLPLSMIGPSHAHKPSFSNPAYRSTRDRPGTPAKPQTAQRWNSQPVLTNVTNRRHSRHGEIKECRLMTELKPDPPAPPPKTPLTSEALSTSRMRVPNYAGQQRDLPAEQTHEPQQPQHPQEAQQPQQSPSLARLADKPRAPSPKRGYQEITRAEPVPYWCGRFAALNDRYRTEELAAHLNNPKSESDKMHSPEANTRRMRRALEHLYNLCATPEARESFIVFQMQYAASEGNPELSRPMQLNMPERRIVLNQSDGTAEMSQPVSEHRKASFMDRLLGRGKGNRRSFGG